MRLVIAILVAVALPLSAIAASELSTKPSNYSVEETVDRLTAALKDKGITPAARVDHAAMAQAAGLELAPTEVLIFGNPKLGTPLMQSNRLVAIDLPMKVLVWQDDGGNVWIGYTPPAALADRYGIDDRDDVLKDMAAALDGLTSAAAN